jgi:hypothetical protein
MSGAVRLFIFGLGYSAQVFVDRFKDRAGSVSGTTRSAEKAAALVAASALSSSTASQRERASPKPRATPRTFSSRSRPANPIRFSSIIAKRFSRHRT